MAGIHGKDTKPELTIRRALHREGFRYRLQNRGLPGRPDLTFASRNAVLFVNGCFWHGHDCHLFKMPATRTDFWRTKIEQNVERDRRNLKELSSQGWRVGLVWECALKGRTKQSLPDIVSQLGKWLTSREERLDIRGT